MKKLRVVLSVCALAGGIGGALAGRAPGDPIVGQAYLSIDGQCQPVTNCNGGSIACTASVGGEDLPVFWDVEDQFGQPSGTCAELAFRTPN